MNTESHRESEHKAKNSISFTQVAAETVNVN